MGLSGRPERVRNHGAVACRSLRVIPHNRRDTHALRHILRYISAIWAALGIDKKNELIYHIIHVFLN